ncbi:MAG: PLP-dependent aspartate aminotransferase family protein [Flavobacteriaceae bacterium]|nr:PLP-dependent aspartate aminotransferase family protein [Flavobacteriaceae bacterium]
MRQKIRFNSKTIHGGQHPDKAYGAVMPPIYQTSTYVQTTPGVHKGYEYSRTHNPTRTALEKSIASLEGTKYGLAFASGMAAIDNLVKLFNPGDQIISTNDLYGGSYRLFRQVYEKYGIVFKFVDLTDIGLFKSHITKQTKMVWIETPTNPMMRIVDIKTISKIAKEHEILVGVDNTFATPYLQKPIKLGADLVMHSATKFLAGHSDTILGLLVHSSDKLHEKLSYLQNASGAVPGPMDCFLVLRGIKTLHLRMQRHSENAQEIVRFLNQHPKVEKVFYPGNPNHSSYQLAQEQMSGFGGMLSFLTKTKDRKKIDQVLSKFQMFTLAESLGGVESLVGHPASMTHASIPIAAREESGIFENLIRLSVGIEDFRDLIDDLKKALD